MLITFIETRSLLARSWPTPPAPERMMPQTRARAFCSPPRKRSRAPPSRCLTRSPARSLSKRKICNGVWSVGSYGSWMNFHGMHGVNESLRLWCFYNMVPFVKACEPSHRDSIVRCQASARLVLVQTVYSRPCFRILDICICLQSEVNQINTTTAIL